MPDSFDFRREMTTFWATETVWTGTTGTGTGSGQTFFSKIEQRPSFIGKGGSRDGGFCERLDFFKRRRKMMAV